MWRSFIAHDISIKRIELSAYSGSQKKLIQTPFNKSKHMKKSSSLTLTQDPKPHALNGHMVGLGMRIAQVAEAVGGKKKLSELIDISEAHLYRYISGKSQPTVGPLLAIARAANVSIDWLVTGAVHPLNTPFNKSISSSGGRGNKQGNGVKGYPEIDPQMLLTTLQSLENYTQTQAQNLRPGVLHDLLLAVCKQHVDRLRASAGINNPHQLDIKAFEETIRLAL